MTIFLPWPNKVLSPNARVHWAVKSRAAKEARKAAHLCTLASKVKVDWEGEIHLWVTFCPPDRRARDDDNLIAAFKSARDGIADALGVNDKRFRMHPCLSDEVVKFGEVRVRLSPGVGE